MTNLEKNLSKQEITSMNPVDLTEHQFVQSKFIDMYNKIHGSTYGEMIFHKEAFNFQKLIVESDELKKCTSISLYSVFLDLAMNGLSLEQGSKPLAYIIPRNANVGTRENANWEKRAYLVVSPYGELVMRVRAGQIKHADNPVIVYDGDVFGVIIDDNGNKRIKYEAVIPRKSNSKIIGAFIKLVRHDGSYDFEYLTMEDVDRLKGYSERANKGKTNALYSSNNGQIDAGFLAGKMIKHAFRSFPKIRLSGIATVAESEIERPEIEADYGFEMDKATEVIDKETIYITDNDQPEYTQAHKSDSF